MTPAQSKVDQSVREYRWLWRLLSSLDGSRDRPEYRFAIFVNSQALPATKLPSSMLKFEETLT